MSRNVCDDVDELGHVILGRPRHPSGGNLGVMTWASWGMSSWVVLDILAA
ncbi:hypothetical protein L195_g013378 [Trifolium pratense]|uniref:Uncharacterized protein n=1 Tax=Trifolium pratense TaxID=57577 RepID=A0A2K3PMZ8_TRIPR|nr:hypothetical protein L195_g013378 [Trifolium pratense]